MTRLPLSRLLPLLVLAAGFAATYLLQQMAFNAALQSQRDAFNYHAREIVLRVEQRLLAYEQVLRGTRGLFMASKSVEREEFRDYVSTLQLAKQYPGVQGVGFSLIVAPQEKDGHIEAVRQEGFPGYTIVPPGNRDFYTAIVFLEPFDERNRRAFGYDMYSQSVRRTAMETARDLDEAAMSGKVILLQETGRDVQAGFLMYVPVYRNGSPHETLAERRANIIGWVYSPFRMNDLMRGILGDQAGNVDIEVYDGEKALPESLMYDSESTQQHGHNALYEFSQCLETARHNWHIRLHSLPVFEASIDTGRATMIRLAGMLVSALLALLVWQLVSGRARALNLADKMTSELRESEATSRAIIEAIPVPLALNDGQGNITYLNRAFAQTIGYTREEIATLTDWWPRAYPEAQYRQWVIENWQRNLENARRSGEPFAPMELNIRCKDGATRTFLTGAATIKENFAGTHLVILYDITGRKQAENELRTLSTAIEQSPLSVVITDLDAHIRYINPHFMKVTGYSREEAIGQNPRILQSGLTPRETYDEMWGALTSGQIWRGELVNKRKSGEFYWEEVHIAPVTDAAGAPAFYVAAKLEITQRKKAEEALRRSEARLHTLYDSTSDAVMLLDEKGFFDCNNATLAIFGCASKEEFCSKHPADLSPPEQPCGTDSMTLAKRKIATAMEKGSNLFEWMHKRADTGKPFPAEVLLSRLVLDDRKVLQATVRDITARRQIEDSRRQIENALAESKNHIEMLLHSVAEGIYGVDAQGNCTFVNSAALRLLGYQDETELLGKHMHDLIHHTRPDGSLYPSNECRLYHSMHAREGIHVDDEVFWRKDGSAFPVDYWSRPTTLNGQDGAVITFIDTTERREHEKELKRSNAELEQFSYAVSHDMRQPLRMVSSYLQLIEMELADQLDSEKRGYFEFAIEGAKRIDQMLVELLEYSRIGRLGEPLTWVDSRALLDEALQFLQPAIAEAQARLNITGEWPRILVCHDEMLRLIQNLVENAVKFRVAGRVPEIIIGSEIVANEWHLHIADNGIGIIPDQIRRLFQVFQRLQLRTTYEGSGVGLALCRKIAEHHKGRIWAESEGEGKGCRFCVALPVPQEKA